MIPLQVSNLTKTYPDFRLTDISFSLDQGKITGLIGRNGAGKSTVLKSLLHFVHPDTGKIQFFGKNFSENELEIKQKIGIVFGGIDYYLKKRLKTITTVTKQFYSNWDEALYQKYLSQFQLDENKTPAQLSSGMRVKYALAIALSHHAELLILDEPTSGLDPVSRDELLSLFLELTEKGTSILFSTHITSDLEKCADSILYIKNGILLAQESLEQFVSSYQIAELTQKQFLAGYSQNLIGTKRTKNGYSALIRSEDNPPNGVRLAPASLESIMIHMEQEKTE